MEKGYLFIATGSKYIEEALVSLRSLKKVNSQVHATLITDEESEVPEFDLIHILKPETEKSENWKEGILYKVRALQLSPYRKTFFVDSDTFFTSDCPELFDLLEYYDLLICKDQARNPPVLVDGKEVSGYAAYNTGVIVYQKNEKTETLFRKWLELYKEKHQLYPHDQPPFMEALLSVSIKVYVLEIKYNFRFSFYGYLRGLVKIIHGRTKHFDVLERELNKETRSRVWLPDRQKIYLPKTSIFKRVFTKISRIFGVK